ncbi:hypothetical protein SLEP1_g44960 [Rubroshorea leprosula]|nr:hypothetical protein SLEP1_g44960 [Rubroshorea leprosula]
MALLSVVSGCSNRFCCVLAKGNGKEGYGHDPEVPMKQKHVRVLTKLAPSLVAALVVLSPISNTPVSVGQTIDIERGASLFQKACIGCHDGGGNIIQPGATLFTKDLER